MNVKKYDLNFLTSFIQRDGAVLVGDYPIINAKAKINFICKCGENGSKIFRSIVELCGVFCKNVPIKLSKRKLLKLI